MKNQNINGAKFAVILLLIISVNLHKSFAKGNEILQKVDKHFLIENKGQWPEEALFLMQQDGLNLWITKKGVLYDLMKTSSPGRTEDEMTVGYADTKKLFEKEYGITQEQIVGVGLKNENEDITVRPNLKCEGKYNYLIGNNKEKWYTDVGLYKEATIKNIYKGIDVRYYFEGENLRYDYIVEANANPKQLVLKIEGANKMYVNNDGDLVFETTLGEIKQAKLYAYQNIEGKSKKIDCEFVINDSGELVFNLGEYDKSRELIIDPIIYIFNVNPGPNDDNPWGLAIDGAHRTYTAGYTLSVNYPTTTGVIQPNMPSGVVFTGFVTRVNAAGTALDYSTFLGGYNYGTGLQAIDVNANGEAYVTGITSSNTYPTVQAFNASYSGAGQDAVVSVLNNAGTALLYSTYFGGGNVTWGLGIKVDPTNSNIAYICGRAYGQIPTTTGPAFGGYCDGFFAKFNTTVSGIAGLSLSRLVPSNIVSPGGYVNCNSIAINSTGTSIYLTGKTDANAPSGSGTFPGTLINGCTLSIATGIYGAFNFFVSKFNSLNGNIVYSTIGGGNGWTETEAIDIDPSSEDAYVTGYTLANNLPAPLGNYLAGTADVFVMKLNSTGVFAGMRYIGGSNVEYAFGINFFNGNVFCTGWTLSPNFPEIPCVNNGVVLLNRDFFVTELDNTNNLNILFSRAYLASGTLDEGRGIAVDNNAGATRAYLPVAFWAGSDHNYAVVSLTPDGPCANSDAVVLNGVINTSPAPSSTGYKIVGNLTITGANVIFSDMDIAVMGPYSIIINSGATLDIKRSHIRGCSSMWRGIIVNTGGKLITHENTLIEDAATSITTNQTCTIDIENTIFNKNQKNIVLNDFYSIGSTSIIIKGSVFTNRDLHNCSSSWPFWYSAISLKTMITPANTVSSPYNLLGLPQSPSLNGDLVSLSHIEMRNIGKTTMAGFVPTYTSLLIGGNAPTTSATDDMNIFEYARTGIDATNSNFLVINSVFQNMMKQESNSGIGIAAKKDPALGNPNLTATRYKISVEPNTNTNTQVTYINKFYDCYIGVQTANYYSNLINGNEFYSNQYKQKLSGTCGSEINGNIVGLKAIDVTSAAYFQIQINRNKIYNHAAGIFEASGLGSSNPNPNYPNIILGNYEINSNTIWDKPNATGTPPADPFIGDAIVAGFMNGSNTTIQGIFGTTANSIINHVSGNNITRCFRGITYSNFKAPNNILLNRMNNNVIDKLMEDYYVKCKLQFGIRSTNNINVEENANTCVGLGSALTYVLWTGILSEGNATQNIQCNVCKDFYVGFKFVDPNNQTRWVQNTMSGKEQYGLQLGVGSTIPAFIGLQSGSTSSLTPSDNDWYGNALIKHTNVTANSNANQSVLIVRPNPVGLDIYKPTLNSGIVGAYGSSTLIVPAGTIPAIQNCPGFPNILPPTPDPSVVANMENVIQNNMNYAGNVSENDWIFKQRGYELQLNDSIYANGSGILDSFYNYNRPQAMCDIKDVENFIDAGNYTAAQTKLSSMTATNQIEQNYIDYFNLVLPFVTNGTWNDSVEGIALYNLAAKCLYIDGYIVSNARVLYNAIYRDQFTVFNDNCVEDVESEDEGEGEGQKINSAISNKTQEFDVLVYPNPSMGGFDLKSNCSSQCNVKLRISSISGQSIFEKSCNLMDGNCFVDSKLRAGTYLITIKTEENKTYQRKLIILK